MADQAQRERESRETARDRFHEQREDEREARARLADGVDEALEEDE